MSSRNLRSNKKKIPDLEHSPIKKKGAAKKVTLQDVVQDVVGDITSRSTTSHKKKVEETFIEPVAISPVKDKQTSRGTRSTKSHSTKKKPPTKKKKKNNDQNLDAISPVDVDSTSHEPPEEVKLDIVDKNVPLQVLQPELKKIEAQEYPVNQSRSMKPYHAKKKIVPLDKKQEKDQISKEKFNVKPDTSGQTSGASAVTVHPPNQLESRSNPLEGIFKKGKQGTRKDVVKVVK